MKVLVSGANGFVGSAVCRALLGAGHGVAALVRAGADLGLLPEGCEVVVGEFHAAGDAARAMRHAEPDAVVHAAAVVSSGRPDAARSVAVNVEGTRTLALAAVAGGARRWIQVSSMSAHPANRSVYGATKLAAERVLEEVDGLDFTILRPSLVYGPQPRGIFHRLDGMVRRWPAIPLVGGGLEPMRPVHVDDVAGAAVAALERPASILWTYPLGGAENWTLRDMVHEMQRRRGKAPRTVPVPLPLARLIALAGEVLLENPPLTSDNVEGIAKAQRVDWSRAARDLGFAPRPFAYG